MRATNEISSPLRARKPAVVEMAECALRRDVPELAMLPRGEVVDHLGDFFERLADWLDGHEDRVALLTTAVEAHALRRFRQGVTIDVLVREYARLRRCLHDELGDEHPNELDDALDVALAFAVRRYHAYRDELRERFVGMLAHDLRSPLSAVAMATDSLMSSDRGVQDKAVLELVLDSTDRMQRLVNDVLALARCHTSDELPIKLREDDLGAVVRTVAAEVRAVHGDQAVSCELTGDLRGHFDRDRMHQLVTNLVRNSIEHGSGAAHVRAAESDAGAALVLVVANRGIRMRARTPEPARRRRTKHGLGLYIVQQIAHAHGATVDLAALGEQGMVTVRWPKEPPMPQTDEQPPIVTSERKTKELCHAEREGLRCAREKGHDGEHESLPWRGDPPKRW